MNLKRVAIYAQDIQSITGRSERYARNVLTRIRRKLKKEPHQLVSVGEFCEYMGWSEEEVLRLLDR